jgi:hypothetical protein
MNFFLQLKYKQEAIRYQGMLEVLGYKHLDTDYEITWTWYQNGIFGIWINSDTKTFYQYYLNSPMYPSNMSNVYTDGNAGILFDKLEDFLQLENAYDTICLMPGLKLKDVTLSNLDDFLVGLGTDDKTCLRKKVSLLKTYIDNLKL